MITHYTCIEISGDYAILRSDEGVENQVALALLPDGVDIGTKLTRDFLEWSLA